MSWRHFIKHLAATTSRHLLPLAPPPSPAALSSRLSVSNSVFPSNFRNFSKSACIKSSSSSSSSYRSVRIRCPEDVSDVLSEALLSFGASSAGIDEEDRDDSSHEVCITSIFPPDEDVGESVWKASHSVGLKELPRYEVKVLEQDDWIKKTQESFVPVEVSNGLWIVPEWRIPPNAQATNIILNPGLAFGTGEHPTTKLCLTLLHNLIKGGEHVLDYGTGSGILAIAALKLGAASAVGVDIDPQAISSARYNAALNSTRAEKLELCLVDAEFHERGGSERENFDMVVANILLNPLLELADHIVSHAKPGATVAISGILCEQLSDITSRYSCLLEELSISEMDGWACVSGKKKKSYC